MEPQTIIARRIARELSPGMLVNLGIGIPTLVANHLPQGMQVFFQSENGLIGTGAPPEEGMAHPLLTDAGGRFRRYKIVDPSFHNWPGLALALRGQAISDFPVCNKSFNLSYCGFDL